MVPDETVIIFKLLLLTDIPSLRLFKLILRVSPRLIVALLFPVNVIPELTKLLLLTPSFLILTKPLDTEKFVLENLATPKLVSVALLFESANLLVPSKLQFNPVSVFPLIIKV